MYTGKVALNYLMLLRQCDCLSARAEMAHEYARANVRFISVLRAVRISSFQNILPFHTLCGFIQQWDDPLLLHL